MTHPLESPKLYADVKKAEAQLGDGSGKVVVEFDYSAGTVRTYNISVVFPRRTP